MEELLAKVARLQEDFKPLEPLLGNVDSVLHFDSISTQYRKKLAEITQKSNQVNDYVVSLRSKSSAFQTDSADTLKDFIRRRNREVKVLEAKLEGIEATYKQLQSEGKAFSQRVVAELEAEKPVFNQRFDEKLASETNAFKAELEKEKRNVRTELEKAKAIVKSVTKGNTAYVKKYGDQLKTAQPKANRPADTIESGKTALVEDLQNRITVGTRDIGVELDKQQKGLTERCQSALVNTASRLRALQANLTPSLQGRGQQLLTCIRLHLDSLYPSISHQTKTCFHLLSSLSDRVSKLKSAEPTEEVKASIATAQGEFAPLEEQTVNLMGEMERVCGLLDGCFDLVTGLETAVQEEVPKERIALMKRFRREYEVKKEKTSKEMQKMQEVVKVLRESVREEKAEEKVEEKGAEKVEALADADPEIDLDASSS